MTAIHYDHAPTTECLNPDVVHICHKCNACGRFPERRRMTLAEIEEMNRWEETEDEARAREFTQMENGGQRRLMP